MVTIPGYVNGVRDQTLPPSQRSVGTEPLSPVAALVRRHDHDRYQTALFAPIARREALFALYAFNYEIARVRETVMQPTLGRIRLEWWRENIAAAYGTGPARRHPVVEPLTDVIREYRLTRQHFERLIDARTEDFDDDPPPDLAALEAYAEGTSARLLDLALEVLRVRDAAATLAARDVGIAFALSGLLRALPMRSPAYRPLIPVEIDQRNGLDLASTRHMRSSPALRAAVAEIAIRAQQHLRTARATRRAVPRAALPALLPAVIAGQSLARLQRAGYDPFDPALLQPDPLQSWRLALAMLGRCF
jgi:NADH dehydrogenase [ubiquinone] 1 alpha subcomplex assembly factor 6